MDWLGIDPREFGYRNANPDAGYDLLLKDYQRTGRVYSCDVKTTMKMYRDFRVQADYKTGASKPLSAQIGVLVWCKEYPHIWCIAGWCTYDDFEQKSIDVRYKTRRGHRPKCIAYREMRPMVEMLDWAFDWNTKWR